MAKMFYTMEEAAEQLGVSTDEIKKLAEEGKLQQFRDRDKVMFKRDQVDSLASERGASEDTGTISMADTSGETDEIDLAAESGESEAPDREDTGGATGVSVFDADEIEAADPMAQTVVSETPRADEEDLSLESVGSGSGLLDLTRESDDTSLGAELLDEIYPAGASEEGEGREETGGFEGIFDSAGGAESAPSAIADVESGEAEPTPAAAGAVAYQVEPTDYVGSGWTGGLLVGALIALILAMLVTVGAMAGIVPALAVTISESMMTYIGGLAVVTLILAAVGGFLGKALGR